MGGLINFSTRAHHQTRRHNLIVSLSGSTSVVGDGKGGIGPRTTHLTSQKFGCCIDGGNFMSSQSRDSSSMSN